MRELADAARVVFHESPATFLLEDHDTAAMVCVWSQGPGAECRECTVDSDTASTQLPGCRRLQYLSVEDVRESTRVFCRMKCCEMQGTDPYLWDPWYFFGPPKTCGCCQSHVDADLVGFLCPVCKRVACRSCKDKLTHGVGLGEEWHPGDLLTCKERHGNTWVHKDFSALFVDIKRCDECRKGLGVDCEYWTALTEEDDNNSVDICVECMQTDGGKDRASSVPNLHLLQVGPRQALNECLGLGVLADWLPVAKYKELDGELDHASGFQVLIFTRAGSSPDQNLQSAVAMLEVDRTHENRIRDWFYCLPFTVHDFVLRLQTQTLWQVLTEAGFPGFVEDPRN